MAVDHHIHLFDGTVSLKGNVETVGTPREIEALEVKVNAGRTRLHINDAEPDPRDETLEKIADIFEKNGASGVVLQQHLFQLKKDLLIIGLLLFLKFCINQQNFIGKKILKFQIYLNMKI